MKDLISIIVPVYNVVSRYPKALETCLQSIQAQTYTCLEIILVDDGSKDESGLVCDQFSEIDPRFHTFHCQNRGMVKAREYGFKQSSGEYIFFSDADDIIHPQCIEIMHKLIVHHPKIRMVTSAALISSSINPEISPILEIEYYVKSQCYYLNQKIFKGRFSVWNKLFHRSLINEIRFNNTELEDFDFYLQAILKCDSIIEIKNKTYYWIQRDLSASHSNISKRYLGILQTKMDSYMNYIKPHFACYIGISLYNLYTDWIDHNNLADDTQMKKKLRESFKEIKMKTWNDFWSSDLSSIKKVSIWWFLHYPSHKLLIKKIINI